MPNGFVVSDAKGISRKSFLESVKLAINIAFGEHGFGKELLNKENPFVLVAIANTPEELENLKQELTEMAKSFGDNVIVDGFVAPEK